MILFGDRAYISVVWWLILCRHSFTPVRHLFLKKSGIKQEILELQHVDRALKTSNIWKVFQTAERERMTCGQLHWWGAPQAFLQSSSFTNKRIYVLYVYINAVLVCVRVMWGSAQVDLKLCVWGDSFRDFVLIVGNRAFNQIWTRWQNVLNENAVSQLSPSCRPRARAGGGVLRFSL